MDLLRKINTKVIRQGEASIKSELYQTIDTILRVDRDRPSGLVRWFELLWDDIAGRKLFVAWERGTPLRSGEVDDGEGFAGARGSSPVEKRSKFASAEIVEKARAVLQERGTKLPADLRESIWSNLGGGSPGARS